ncbi:MAG: glucokinase, partial [Myxococcota bacterium]
GATKTRLAWIEASEVGSWHQIQVFETTKYGSFGEIIEVYCGDTGCRPEGVCLGIAGPVRRGEVFLTNVGWGISQSALCAQLGLTPDYVVLMNDLQAMAHGIPVLREEDVFVLQEGEVEQHAPIAVVAAGTGLGEGLLFWDGQRYHALASEGGHRDFAPVDQEQVELLTFVQKSHERVSYERVCSGGVGLENLVRFYRARGLVSNAELDRMVEQNSRALGLALVRTADDQENPASELCVRVLSMLCRILTAEMGNVALQALPFGGLYVGGGLAVQLREQLASPEVFAAFGAKGRWAPLMKTFAVRVILHPEPGLLGLNAVAKTRMS